MKVSLAPPLPKEANEDLILRTFWPLALVLSRFFFLLSDFLWPSGPVKSSVRSLPYLFRAPRRLLPKVALSSLFWPRHRSRARRTYPYLYWVSTLEERPALGVLSTLIHVGQQSCSGAHAYGEAYTTAPYHSWSV